MPHRRPSPVSGAAGSALAADAGNQRAGPPARRGSGTAGSASERTDVLRLRSLLPLGRVELDLLVLIQRPVAGARDRGKVHEHVRRPVIGGDKTKALIGVEPLHCSCCHQSMSSIRDAATRPAAPTQSLPVPAPAPGLPMPGPPRTCPASVPCSGTRP